MSDTPTGDDALPAATPAAPTGPPSPVDLVGSTLSVFMDNILPMLMLGLGQLVVWIVASVFLLPLMLGCMFAFWGVLSGGGGLLDALLDANGQVGASIGVFGFLASYLFAIFGFLIAVTIVASPFAGSMMRSLDAHLAGEAEATFSGVYDTAFQQPVKDILSNLLLIVLVLIGLPFCYVGALIPGFFLMWMTLACEVDGLTLGQAIRRSIQTIRERPGWSLGVYALGIVFGMLAGYVPILGQVAAILFMLRAYRAIHPRQATL